jgi:hypothetical protein
MSDRHIYGQMGALTVYSGKWFTCLRHFVHPWSKDIWDVEQQVLHEWGRNATISGIPPLVLFYFTTLAALESSIRFVCGFSFEETSLWDITLCRRDSTTTPTTQCYIPEDFNLQQHSCGSLKSRISIGLYLKFYVGIYFDFMCLFNDAVIKSYRVASNVRMTGEL